MAEIRSSGSCKKQKVFSSSLSPYRFFDTSPFPTALSAHISQTSKLTFIRRIFCSTIYGLKVYWWWTCLFKIKWFVAHGENVDFQIDQRDNILIVLEVVYNQFCNPQCFGNSQQFSWQKSGYIDGYVEGREVEFDTPIKCCFPKYNVTICQRQDCQDLSFIRCSYYSLSFCFDHFILNKHVHHQ